MKTYIMCKQNTYCITAVHVSLSWRIKIGTKNWKKIPQPKNWEISKETEENSKTKYMSSEFWLLENIFMKNIAKMHRFCPNIVRNIHWNVLMHINMHKSIEYANVRLILYYKNENWFFLAVAPSVPFDRSEWKFKQICLSVILSGLLESKLGYSHTNFAKKRKFSIFLALYLSP